MLRTKWVGVFTLATGLVTSVLFPQVSQAADQSLLNVSYDVTREYYKDLNAAFISDWKAKTGNVITIKQSHGGSSKQARAVTDGLEADIISMNQAPDIDILYERGKLLPKNWQTLLPYDSSPSTSTTVFLVRKGNPKGIKDWNDLVKNGVKVIIPNPKTSGNGKYSYLAAWGNVIINGGSPADAKKFVTQLFKNVPVLDTGGRGATTTFAQRGIGDVLLTFENEVQLIKAELGDNYDVVYPKASIEAENPIALVKKYVEKHNTKALAQAYADYHFSVEGQKIAAKHFLRPKLESVAKEYQSQFKPIKLFNVETVFGGWANAQKVHFADGGTFDQIYLK